MTGSAGARTRPTVRTAASEARDVRIRISFPGRGQAVMDAATKKVEELVTNLAGQSAGTILRATTTVELVMATADASGTRDAAKRAAALLGIAARTTVEVETVGDGR